MQRARDESRSLLYVRPVGTPFLDQKDCTESFRGSRHSSIGTKNMSMMTVTKGNNSDINTNSLCSSRNCIIAFLLFLLVTQAIFWSYMVTDRDQKITELESKLAPPSLPLLSPLPSQQQHLPPSLPQPVSPPPLPLPFEIGSGSNESGSAESGSAELGSAESGSVDVSS